MKVKGFPLFAAAVSVLLALTGCVDGSDSRRPTGQETKQGASRAPEADRLPVPKLKVGEPFAADLPGNGQATITVTEAVLSKLDGTSDRLVVTVNMRLDKVGKPIPGGPDNFRFLDKDSAMHQAQTDEQAFPPQLATVSLTTVGQSAGGRLFFDVPAGGTEGGYIQLMTGALVHAVWTV